MKNRNFKDLSVDELKHKEKDLREEQFRLRMRHAAGQLESPASLVHVRKNIARIKTVLREKEAIG
ncbi:MAG TPA: 50S ribosomal protein L29 [Syntrophales bacterium]|nr:50S ribosomal protein L29 [Syntrophales bacterium]